MGDESRIWIGGLPESITEEAIKEEYDKYGDIKNVQIRSNAGSPAFAFVQYSDRRDAEDAVRSTDQQKLFGMRFVKVSWAGKGAPGKGKGKGKGKNRSRSRGRRSRSRSRSQRRSPSRRDSRGRSRSPPAGSRSRSPPARRASRSRDGRPPPGRSRSGGGGGRGRSPSGGQGKGKPGWHQKPSEVQGKYRMKIEKLPEDMGWQELKGLGTKLAKVGQCTFSRTNRDRTGVLEFTNIQDMEGAINELDGRRFSGGSERVKAYEERNTR